MTLPLIRFGRLTIAALSILLAFTPALEIPALGQNSDNELNQDIAKLDSFLADRNLDSVEATVNRESSKWQERDRSSYISYMFKA